MTKKLKVYQYKGKNYITVKWDAAKRKGCSRVCSLGEDCNKNIRDRGPNLCYWIEVNTKQRIDYDDIFQEFKPEIIACKGRYFYRVHAAKNLNIDCKLDCKRCAAEGTAEQLCFLLPECYCSDNLCIFKEIELIKLQKEITIMDEENIECPNCGNNSFRIHRERENFIIVITYTCTECGKQRTEEYDD